MDQESYKARSERPSTKLEKIPLLQSPSRQIQRQIDELHIEVEPTLKEDLTCPTTPLKETDIKTISDWDAYYRVNACSPDTIRILKQCQEKTLEWLKIKDSAPWKMQEENVKERLTVECYTSARGNNSFKACSYLPYKPWLVFRVLDNPAYKPLYDVNIDYECRLQKLAANTFIGHKSIYGKGVWPITTS